MRAPGDEEKEIKLKQKAHAAEGDTMETRQGSGPSWPKLSERSQEPQVHNNIQCSCGGWRTVATETTIGPHRAIGDVIARVCGGSMLFLQLFAPSSLRSRQRGASQS
ncbi:uncharacterized protein LOC129604640 isoform X1 [Betta splendens]|uniref:Uncharacterized protein LOC129604627 isoform X1 n=1 Tax=Betta splendens TaxID=158456 RepID=A0A9W2Y226_BETSP|nr:uncharacterized protein LOC129604627 isoform X1 [Betta splendens]XP_055367929.1 uncharacterized protein LOC129604640 isoform X1 [Betta splendens]